MIEVRWLGRGGQGCFTAARLLGMAVALGEGRHALAFPSFGPERRGAPVLAYTRVDDKPIRDRGDREQADWLVVLDDSLLREEMRTWIGEKGVILVNSRRQDWPGFEGKVQAWDAQSWAMEILGKPLTNTAMLGVLAARSGLVSLASLDRTLSRSFSASLREGNQKLLQAAWEQAGGISRG